MKYILGMMALVAISCGDGKKYHKTEEKPVEAATSAYADVVEFQKELNAEYKDPEESPLPDRYRMHFEGLEFFPIDTTYRVTARFERTPDALPFQMSTTTDRVSEEVVYGIVHFTLQGKPCKLEVYQSKELMKQEKYRDYLFLPFMDDTNGDTSYGGGRYIDLTIPDGDSIVIDFNKAYNPYCAYNKKYSCPVVPKVNTLPMAVNVGVKIFKH